MFKKGYLVFFSLFTLSNLLAQTSTTSPYSSQGIGLWQEPTDAVYSGMGGARIGIVDSVYANDYNPASYSRLGKGMPLFSFDLSSRLSFYQSQNGKDYAQTMFLNKINIAIPFAKRFGLAIGMRPILKRGYDFAQYGDVDGDSIKYTYQGKGEIEQVYFAFSSAVINKDRHFLSLGLEGQYNFGTLTNTRVDEFVNTSSSYSAADESSFRVRAFSLRAGLQYKFNISKTRAFSIGAVYQPQVKWNATGTEYLYRYTGQYGIDNVPGSTDTLFYVGDQKGNMTIPQRIGIGASWEMKAREDSLAKGYLKYRLRFSADYELMSWNNYSLNFPTLNSTSTKLTNASYFRFGIEFVPHHYFDDSKPNINYMTKIKYRIGFNYSTLPTQVNVTKMKGMAVTFGFGLPIPIRNAYSSVNLGVTLGQQGAIAPNSIREQYIRIQLGLVLSPGVDRWFRKYKYN